MNAPSLRLAVGDRDVDELGVFGLLDSGENEGRVRGRVLGLVDSDGCERSRGSVGERAETEASLSGKSSWAPRKVHRAEGLL